MNSPSIPPAYRIETNRLVIRCYDPKDASLVKDAIDSSLEHLRAWMPWAWLEPTSLDEKVELLRRFRARFDQGEDFIYVIFDRQETRVLGSTGLHTRVGFAAREIGYWIRKDSINKGLVTEAAAALTRVGFEHLKLDRIEIHIDVDNHASAAVPPKLGYTLEATLRRRLHRLPAEQPEETRTDQTTFSDAQVWTMFASDYPASPCSNTALRAYDAAGRLVLG